MYLNAEQLAKALPWHELIAALSDVFTKNVQSPVRHHHRIEVPGDVPAMLLLMPAWIEGEYLGVKQVNVFPGNNQRNQPGLSSHYLLSSASTGLPLAQFDGNELTARRTAAASALASQYLSRENATKLLMVGAGRMGRYLVRAHRAVRELEDVKIYDRSYEAAVAFANELHSEGIKAEAIQKDGLPQAVGNADIVSCATLANDPIILGEWLKPGVHLDLVGSFAPSMREADDEVVRRCSIFVDTREGALAETGDLITPIKTGVITKDDVLAEFTDLCAGKHNGRASLSDPDSALTLFKSVGASVEDLAAAILAYKRSSVEQQ
ncbi:ornithine cyclodeaminase [Pseudomonas putida]|uniref:Ornithine cyclodeaminase n=1 Tax=Pseudomonas putida TaxID=303 RepID=A0AA37VTD5_PSEPU|nr:ornithine cyclodeaminase family protein [Pseudomonas putida]GLO16094.1 ornithine cyclodeaminase [Pseudomonas putida]GLO37847.1 ornithine cyclodeaminase [Pseudomonas putida]HDS0965068.1 ornithine cyclodeaminase family protein [Pseudomonas putida]HDS0991450.1 ornithine cyclodeaminase family protein [Pseudomonas putida]